MVWLSGANPDENVSTRSRKSPDAIFQYYIPRLHAADEREWNITMEYYLRSLPSPLPSSHLFHSVISNKYIVLQPVEHTSPTGCLRATSAGAIQPLVSQRQASPLVAQWLRCCEIISTRNAAAREPPRPESPSEAPRRSQLRARAARCNANARQI